MCNECDSGYTLIKSKEGKSFCIELPEINNCLNYEIDVDNKYKCKECVVTDSSNYILETITLSS